MPTYGMTAWHLPVLVSRPPAMPVSAFLAPCAALVHHGLDARLRGCTRSPTSAPRTPSDPRRPSPRTRRRRACQPCTRARSAQPHPAPQASLGSTGSHHAWRQLSSRLLRSEWRVRPSRSLPVSPRLVPSPCRDDPFAPPRFPSPSSPPRPNRRPRRRKRPDQCGSSAQASAREREWTGYLLESF